MIYIYLNNISFVAIDKFLRTGCFKSDNITFKTKFTSYKAFPYIRFQITFALFCLNAKFYVFFEDFICYIIAFTGVSILTIKMQAKETELALEVLEYCYTRKRNPSLDILNFDVLNVSNSRQKRYQIIEREPY